MRRLLLAALALSLLLPGADTKKKPKPPVVQVLEAQGHREEGLIKIDGRVRNSGERPIEGLILLFDFMAPGKQVVTTQKAPVDDDTLDPGEEVSFHVELSAPPRAVEYRLNAEDKDGREWNVIKPGPYPIE